MVRRRHQQRSNLQNDDGKCTSQRLQATRKNRNRILLKNLNRNNHVPARVSGLKKSRVCPDIWASPCPVAFGAGWHTWGRQSSLLKTAWKRRNLSGGGGRLVLRELAARRHPPEQLPPHCQLHYHPLFRYPASMLYSMCHIQYVTCAIFNTAHITQSNSNLCPFLLKEV